MYIIELNITHSSQSNSSDSLPYSNRITFKLYLQNCSKAKKRKAHLTWQLVTDLAKCAENET